MQNIPGSLSLFASSWSMFKAHWKPLVSISAASSLALYIGQLMSSSASAALVALGVLLIVIGGIVSIALQPALILSIHAISRDPSVQLSFVSQYKAGFRYFWAMLGLAILHGIILAGSAVTFFIPAIIVEVYTCLYIFSRVTDGKKGLSAFTESYSVVKGRWWGTLGRLLFLVAVYAAFSVITVGLIFLIGKAAGFSLNSPGSEPVSGFLNLILNSAMMPLVLVYLYRLYEALKATRRADVRTEGLRKWLIFFMVVIAAVIILLPALGFDLSMFMPGSHI